MAERTIFIEDRCKLSSSNRHLIAEKKEEKQEYHFDEFDTIIVSSSDVNFSVLLMQSLIEEEKTIIVCDSRRFPSVSMLPMFGTQDCFCRLTEQMSWPQVAKDEVWRGIVENKIENQKTVLKKFNSVCLSDYCVAPGDASNAEGKYASIYFRRLFGRTFRRQRGADAINCALDYGYTILCSQMARIIAAHGYNTALGVHHIGKNNNYNFACDLVEPFRPLVDIVVKKNQNRELDRLYKTLLIEAAYSDVSYGGKTVSAKQAMELFFLEVVRIVKNGSKFENKVVIV